MVPCSSRLPHLGEGRRTGLTAAFLLLLLTLLPLAGAPAALAQEQPRPPAATDGSGLTGVRDVEPVRPVAPSDEPGAPATTPAPRADDAPRTGDGPAPSLDLRGPAGGGAFSNPLALVLLLGALSLLPALLIMVTAFTRIVVVLGFVRTALGTQGVPPNQVIIGLALFLTLFVMGPVFSQANEEALQPYLKQEIDQGEAFERGLEPFRGFMLEQVREEDLQLFVDLSEKPQPANEEDVATATLIPAFIISELRAAFLIGFVIFIPFVVIDLVVSAALSAMGMAMLPPSLVSLPFKLLLFVAVDGWSLVVESLVKSFS